MYTESDNKEINIAVGQKLRDIRISQGKSQQCIADLAGIDRSNYCNIELGKEAVTTVRILKITKALGIKPGELLDDLVDIF